jgi:hypothetical protein
MIALHPIGAAEMTPAGVTLNVREYGAIGDGQAHPVSEWISAGKFSDLRALRRQYPFVDNLSWTIDEVAFESAKLALPANGGTLYFPAGHYIAGRHGWRIWRDHVRLLGDGSEKSILATTPAVPEGVIISPYRHVGWLEGASREFPFEAETGRRGEKCLKLLRPEWVQEFKAGELVFIRNGANRFDQDYGEFNEISEIGPDGSLRFKQALARDYTLDRFNWAAEVAREFSLPPTGRSVAVQVRSGEGFFEPHTGATVTLGENIFRVRSVTKGSIQLENPGRANDPPGTLIPAGTKIGKSRAVIKVTRTARNFRGEGLQIVGRRKVLNLSNSYDVAFADCTFRRDARDTTFKGGLTIDGDGGRFARFERCTVIAEPPIGMQFARSFGGVRFEDCRFVDTNVAFTEFNFDCEVTQCTFEVNGSRALTQAVIAGKSCGGLRFIGNRIQAGDVLTIFDTYSDIHSPKHGSEGEVVVRDNIITTDKGVRVFTFPRATHIQLENNSVTQR